jgi:putative Mg2+ transporter-C (MgtC) family protein
VDPGTQLDVIVRLTLALLIGAVIGYEREYRGHDAGIRTMALVSVGSCVFTAAGLYIFPGHNTDPTRIAAQVVTGVGFLGAGAIFRSDNGIKGLTTAAAVWVVAALGMATGFGLYLIAFAGTAIVLAGLVLVRPLEKRLFGRADHPMRRRTDDPSSLTS